jgi:outer membrane immunogenic protein
MKKILLTGTALLVIASGSAMAADLSRPSAPAPVYTKAPMIAPFSWTGIYIGGDVGYGYAQSTGTVADPAGIFASVPYSFNVNGPLAGGFIGGNYQMGQLVVGAEADWQWANLTGNSGSVPGFGGALTASSTVKSYGSARGRLGYAVDHWLFFGTAGWAWGTWSTSYGPTAGAVVATDNATSTKGWTAGAGIEYAFTNNILGRVEYRYTDLGSVSFVAPGLISELGNKITISDIRAGLSFKFGGMY